MQGHGGIKLCLGGAHLERHAGQLHHFGGIRAADMDAQHAVALALDDHLHHHALGLVAQHIGHGPEGRAEDLDVLVALAGLVLGQTDRAQLRCGEHRGRDQLMVADPGVVAEHGVGKGMPFADGHWRELHPVGHVAHRPDIADTGL